MKYTVAIAAFAAVAAAQSSSDSTSTPSRTSASTTSSSGGNTGIPYPLITTVPTPTQTKLSDLESLIENVASDILSWHSSVTAQPAFSQFTSALGSAAAKSDVSELLATGNLLDHTSLVESLATATPTWWTKLPTSAQAWYTSINAEEASIISSDFLGPAAPTAAPVMKAAGVAAAGALAGAALLL